jgi:acyl-CoA thioester hydrolase
MYTKSFIASWADMDFNAHMKNTAFLDRAADVRMMFFSDNGFPMSEFVRLRIGPVIMKDEVEYFREIALLEPFSVNLELAGLAPDGSRFVMRNTTIRGDGKPCARVTSAGGWLDLGTRRLAEPPASLLAALNALDRTLDFVHLPPSTKSGA